MTQRALLGLSLFVLTANAAFAQLQGSQPASSPRHLVPDLGAQLSSWRATHGPEWRVAPDRETGWLQMLYGGHTAATVRPTQDEQFFDLARAALDASAGMHGIETSTLENVRTMHLPLGIIGSSDKMTVRFRQLVGGVPVEDGLVNVLFDMRGSLLSIQTIAMPRVAGFDVSATIASDAALQGALEAFRARAGLLETSYTGPELVVDQFVDEGLRTPRLAWKIDVHADHQDVEAEGFEWFVDAKTGEIYRSERTVHNFDVSGSVTSNSTPGLQSDHPGNPPVQQAMRFMNVQSGATVTQTDTNGNFTLPGLTAPVQATFSYASPLCVVLNDGGTAYTLTTTLSQPTGNQVQMATSPTEETTAQANAFRCVHHLRDFIKALNPSDTTADFTVICHVMIASSCNATYNGSAINFYRANASCSNFAFSTIVAHELGHWMNSRYGTGNGSDGMGEGNADVWAMYIYDDPVGGAGAFNGSGFIRTGNNTRQFCGDTQGGCYQEVHDDGEVWMGAAWKIRTRLNTLLGDAAGDLVADTLFLDWMTAYNQTQIRSIIETQWLTLDDDNGNLSDGTPHLTPIDQGFRDQGFPGLPDLVIDNVVPAPDTISTVGPYLVSARITTQISPAVSSAFVRYRINGGAFQTTVMTPVGGNVYTAAIPGQPMLSHVEYYIQASPTLGGTVEYPVSAPGAPLDFDIGIKHVLRSHDFEAATTEGWTNGAYNGTNEWQRGVPAGDFGTNWSDPSQAASPNNCWGQDLGATTGGTYSSNSFTWLRSPATNCTGAVGTRLRFNRWLSVQGSGSDQARILVNGTQIYLNPTTSIDDGEWVAQDLNISALADNNAAVTIEWSVQANGSSNRGGWNIDDMRIVWVEAPAVCPPTFNYCISAPNSVGPGALMGSLGTQLVSQNDFELQCTGCPPFTSGLFFYGQTPIQVPFGNGFRCVGGAVRRFSVQQTDFLGDARRALDLPNLATPIQAGETWRFQFWYRNPAAGGAGFNLSDGLAVPFCP